MSNDPYYMVPDELKNLLTQVTSEEFDDTIIAEKLPVKDEIPSYIAEIKSPKA